jgi:ribosomal protein S18 acetylase RimI-like enzyme
MNATLCPVPEVTAEWVRAAHGDAWQVLGRDRAELAGVRVMATGLPHAQWNNADVDDPARADVDAVRAWSDARRGPWGMRLPLGATWPHGRKLFTKRLMGCLPGDFVATPTRGVRTATTADLASYVHVDSTAFEEPPDVQRPWLELLLGHPAATVAVVEVDGAVVASGHVVVADGRAGRSGYVGGIAVLPEARRRGIGAGITSWLMKRAYEAGAELCHLHPDSDEAARIYTRLGYVEVDGFDVYVAR